MSLARLFRTVRHLRPIQIGYRPWFRLYRPSPNPSPAPSCRSRPNVFVAPVPRSPSMLGAGSFSFLNQLGDIHDSAGWSDTNRSHLWLYHLHYFDDLNAVDSGKRATWHMALLSRWIAENPPGQGVGWEPYPTSLRIANWLKWHFGGGALADEAIESLAVQARWLERRLEYHLLGNHLLANAKALTFAGMFFEGKEGRRWRDKGLNILEREIAEQILEDGGHFERTPMYHHLVLEDLLDLANLFRAYETPIPDWLIEPLPLMFRWADEMRHPDGGLAFFNDTTFDVAPEYSELSAYAERLDIAVPEHRSGSSLLSSSGYVRLEGGGYTMLVDVAPVGPDYLPGHAHADTLSLELSSGVHRLLVNSGISLYEAGSERDGQRGTATHNTVRIDGTDSSEVWAGFRVGRRARVDDLVFDPSVPKLAACHDGYRHLPGRPIHRREVRISEGVVQVTDRIEGGGNHRIEGFWHLHPEVDVEPLDDRGTRFRLRIPGNGPPTDHEIAIEGAVQVAVERGSHWHPGFGHSVPNARLVFRAKERLPLRILTCLRPASG